MVHAIDFGRVEKALHVLAHAEDCWSLFSGVTSDAFKNTGAVVQHVRHHVHSRIIPFDKFAVMPDNVADAWCFDIFHVAVF